MADTILGITLNDSSLAASWGLKPDEFIQGIGSKVLSAINSLLVGAKELLQKMAAGAAAVIESIRKGNFMDLLKGWINSSPGGAAAAVAGGVALILAGGVVIAAAATGIAAIAGAIAGAGFLTQAAILAVVVPLAIQAAQQIDKFDWQKTDAKIEEELQSKLTGLYAVAGESTGRALAGLLIGKGKRAAVQVNMRATATFFLILEDQGKTEVQEEVLEALTQLAWAGARFAVSVGTAKAYMYVRKWARENVRTGIPEMDEAIAQWGVEEGKSWQISAQREKTVDKVKESDKNLGEFLENFLEGFGEGLTDFLILEYSR